MRAVDCAASCRDREIRWAATAASRCRSLVRNWSQATSPAARARARRTDRVAADWRSRRVVRAAARRSRSRAAMLAVRKARSRGVSSSGAPTDDGAGPAAPSAAPLSSGTPPSSGANASSAASSRVPRYKAPGSWSSSCHSPAASVSRRCTIRRPRSSSIQPRSRGQDVISASWASPRCPGPP